MPRVFDFDSFEELSKGKCTMKPEHAEQFHPDLIPQCGERVVAQWIRLVRLRHGPNGVVH